MWFSKHSGRMTRHRLSARHRKTSGNARRHRLGFESLEARQMLTVSVSVSGGEVTFIDDSSGIVDTTLTLQSNAADELEWQVNNGGFTNNLGGGQTRLIGDIISIRFFAGVGADNLLVDLGDGAYRVGFTPGALKDSPSFQLARNDTDFIGVRATGIEHISLLGAFGDDDLAVSLFAESETRVTNAQVDGLITSDELPDIQFLFMQSVLIQAGDPDSSQKVTFVTPSLQGVLSSFEFRGAAGDTLVLEGGNSADRWDVKKNGDQVEVLDATSMETVSFDDTDGVNVVFRGLGGDDNLHLLTGADDGSDVIQSPIVFEGGLGNNSLNMETADPPTVVDEAIFTPNQSSGHSTLRYEDAANAVLMSLELVGVQTVRNAVTSRLFTVNGTNLADSFGALVATGVVDILANSTRLSSEANQYIKLNGLGGNDTFNIDESGTPPVALARIDVDGGAGADRLIVSKMGSNVRATALSIRATGKIPLVYSNFERLRFDRSTLADISTLIKVSVSGGTVGNPTATRKITFKNTSNVAIEGSFVAVFKLPSGVTLTNATGTTKFVQVGSKFIRFNPGAGRLEPSASFSINADFRFASITDWNNFKSKEFSVKTYAGPHGA